MANFFIESECPDYLAKNQHVHTESVRNVPSTPEIRSIKVSIRIGNNKKAICRAHLFKRSQRSQSSRGDLWMVEDGIKHQRDKKLCDAEDI